MRSVYTPPKSPAREIAKVFIEDAPMIIVLGLSIANILIWAKMFCDKVVVF